MQLLADDILSRYIVLLYGPPGSRKSTISTKAPNPVFLDLDGGLKTIKCAKTPRIKTFPEFISMLKEAGESNFDTIVIDTIDVMEELLHSQLCKKHNWENMSALGYGKCYDFAHTALMFVLDMLLKISETKNIILIGHENIKPFKDPTADQYDRYDIRMNKRTSGVFLARCDACLFVCNEKITRKDNGNDDRIRAISTGRYVAVTQESASVVAKNRFMMPEKVPLDDIWNYVFYPERLKK